MARQYRTKPFNPVVSERQATAEQIARQLEALINEGAEQGWTYQSYETVLITINPGCLNMFGGQRTASHGIAVFYRDV